MIFEVKSTRNQHYKQLKKIVKEQKNFVVIEGKKLLKETVNSFVEVESIYIDKRNIHLVSEIFGASSQIKVIFVQSALLADIYTTDSKPTSNDLVIAIAKRPSYDLDQVLQSKKDLIFLENVQDPSNVGAIIRSALAFDIGGLFLSEGSVNPYNTKVVRASAGALFKIPVCITSDSDNLFKAARKKGYEIIATSTKGEASFKCLEKQSPCIFLLGGEGSGLSAKALKYADICIQVPTTNKVESLNVNVAAGIIFWERYKYECNISN